ncbi:MAG: efflux RND transporter periplasmic adaptor subunit [Spirochaetales bacterium]|nr:efflux RND transporter periplasmic adaptor subunit [Spirochaetales bacterium]
MTKNRGVKMAAVTVVVMIAGVLAAGPSLLAVRGEENAAAGEENGEPVFSVKTVPAEHRTLEVFLEVNGDIISGQQADVFPDTSGKLIAVRAALGSRVRKGDLIAEIDPSKPGMRYMASPVYAPISGTVSRMPVCAGMTVGAGTSITTISVAENLEITARIPERKVAGLEEGLKSEIRLQAYPSEIFTATVTHVSPVIDSASRTKLITLKFDSYDRRVNAGMFARLRINTINYSGVLAVPAQAVLNKHGVSVVYVTRGGRAELRQVGSGVTINGFTEITSGLSAGERVVIQGQQLLSAGAAVRVIGGGEA